MSKTILFNNQKIKRPGAYSEVVSGIKNPPVELDFGGITIVDDGSLSAGWGGGSGVAGTFEQNKKSIYTFADISEFRKFMGGGYWHLLANGLFIPNGFGTGTDGASYIQYVRAAATTPAELTYAPTGGGAGGGSLVVQPLHEGLVGNGIQGDETRSSFVFEVITAGAAGNVIDFQVNEGAGLVSKGDYTVIVGDTTIDVASGIADAISTAGAPYGYSATSNGATVAVEAPINSGITPTGYAVAVSVTGGIIVTAPTAFGSIAQVDTHTLTGTSGEANINVNGIDYLVTFNTSLTQTALDFITTHAAALDADGITVTSSVADLILTAQVSGTPFVSVAAANDSGDLAGSLTLTTVNGSGLDGIDGTKLTQGFSFIMKRSDDDITKYVMEFYRGTFTGYDSDGTPFDGIEIEDAIPQLLVISDEYGTLPELIAWMQDSFEFSKNFVLKDGYTVTGSGTVNDADLTTYASNTLAVNGVETYSSTHFDNALDLLKDSRTSSVIAGRYGSAYQHANNIKLEQYVSQDARFKKQLYIAAGTTEAEFESVSVVAAESYNNQFVTVVHGGALKTKSGGGFKEYDALYKAALAIGRESGIEPQVPLTFKAIDIDGEIHELSDKQIDKAIDKGLLVSVYDEDLENFVFVKGNNTLQANDNLINENSTTSSKQLLRIILQVNKELPINAKKTLLSNPDGNNRNTLSKEDILTFTETYLSTKIANLDDDNIIKMFKNIQVSVEGTAYYVTYDVEPNFEVEFLFFTGTIIDPNS